MSIYSIKLTKSAEKSLLKIRQSLPAIGKKISDTIDILKTSPHYGKKLEGSQGQVRRIRIGDYRIIYEVHEHVLLIMVIYVGTRGGAY